MPGIAQYKSVQVATATPERLMVMLFDAALNHMRTGRKALQGADHKAAATALEKAGEIVLGLDGVFKDEAAPELAQQVHEIYRFVVGRLTLAMVNRQTSFVDEAERAFSPVAEAFRQAALQGAATAAAARPAQARP